MSVDCQALRWDFVEVFLCTRRWMWQFWIHTVSWSFGFDFGEVDGPVTVGVGPLEVRLYRRSRRG